MTDLIWARDNLDFVANGSQGVWRITMTLPDPEMIRTLVKERMADGRLYDPRFTVSLYLNDKFFAPFIDYVDAVESAAMLDRLIVLERRT